MNKKATWIFVVCLLSTLAAVGTHAYLTNHHYEIKYGQMAEGGLCNINETVNCKATTLSSYSEIFGIPVAILGALANLALVFLLLTYWFPIASYDTRKKLNGTLRLTSLGIFLVSVVFAFLSYGVLNTFCPGCTTAYVLSLVTLVTTWMVTDKAPLFTSMDMKLYPVMGILCLGVAWGIHNNKLEAYGGSEMMKIMKLQLKDWKRAPEKTVTPHAPIIMNASKGAKMKIVEFADFLCGHCAKAYPILHSFAENHPDVEFSFQAWPLDGECNSAIPHAEGTRCMLARISHCANEQGKAWKTQEYIFQNQRSLMSKEMVKSNLKEKASELNLDYEKLISCVDSDEAREAIRGQAKAGNDLNINGTPSVFINGRKVSNGFTVPLLEMIYQEITR